MVRARPGATTRGCPQRPPKPPSCAQSPRPSLMPLPPATDASVRPGLPLPTSCTASAHLPHPLEGLVITARSQPLLLATAPTAHPGAGRAACLSINVSDTDTLLPATSYLPRGGVSEKEWTQRARMTGRVGWGQEELVTPMLCYHLSPLPGGPCAGSALLSSPLSAPRPWPNDETSLRS